MHLGSRNNLAAFVTFKKALGTPVGGAPIPSVWEARAVDNVTNYQLVGLKSLAAPYQRTHLEFVIVYGWNMRSVFDPMQKTCLASEV